MDNKLKLKKDIEDKIVGIIDRLSHLEKLIVYKYLRGQGLSMESIDYEIDKHLRDLKD